MKKNNIVRQLLFYLVAILLIVGAVSALSSRGTQSEKTTYDDVIRYFQQGVVREVVVTPKNVLELSKTRLNAKGYHPAEVVRPEDCIGCASCARIAPQRISPLLC